MNRAVKDALRLRPLTRLLRARIRSGPNEGMTWSLATRRAFLTGAFERPRIEAIAALAEGCELTWDIGASLGYVSLVLARRSRQVVALEPNRSNLWYLHHHLRWNGIANCHVVEAAVDAQPGVARFNPRSSGTGYVSKTPDAGTYEVPVLTFDQLLDQHGGPEFIKIDIDHNTVDCFGGATRLLQLPHLAMVVATNGSQAIHSAIRRKLEEAGLTTYEPHRCSGGRFEGIESELLAHGRGASIRPAALERFLES